MCGFHVIAASAWPSVGLRLEPGWRTAWFLREDTSHCLSWGRALPGSDCACFQPELAAALSGLADVLGGRDCAQSRQPSQQLCPYPESEPAVAALLMVLDDNLSPSVLLLHPYSWSRSSQKGFFCVWEGLASAGRGMEPRGLLG